MNLSQYLEHLRDDARDEIKRRIEQRDKYSLQFTVALSTILAVFSLSKARQIGFNLDKIILVTPMVSIYFSVLILYSYRVHYILALYLREKIEPKLAILHKIPRDYEWENFYRTHSIPGIRKRFFVILPWIMWFFVLIYSIANYSHEFFPWIITVFFVYLPILLYLTYEFWDDHKNIEKFVRDWPPVVRPKYKQAVFIDRDGTINEDTGFTYKVKDLKIPKEVKNGFEKLKQLPLHIIVITNQAGISLGYYKQRDMSKFNKQLRKKIEKLGGRIDAIYFSPYLEPKHLLPNEPSSEYSKPNPGLLIRAARDFELNLKGCYLIGDKLSDIMAGNSVGCATFLIRGKGNTTDMLSVRPDYLVENLSEAVEKIFDIFGCEAVKNFGAALRKMLGPPIEDGKEKWPTDYTPLEDLEYAETKDQFAKVIDKFLRKYEKIAREHGLKRLKNKDLKKLMDLVNEYNVKPIRAALISYALLKSEGGFPESEEVV